MCLHSSLFRVQLPFCGCQISWDDLKDAEAAVGEFGGDNRAGEPGRAVHDDLLQAALLSVS